MGLTNRLNNGILDTVLTFLGVKEIKASTDTPSAKLTIEFKQWGKPKRLELTIQEIISAITQGADPGPDTAQGGRPEPD